MNDDTLNTEFIIGAAITQICLGLHQLQLKFNNSATVGVGAGMDIFYTNGKTASWNSATNYQKIEFDSILEQEILNCKYNRTTKNLELIFKNGTKVLILSQSDGFESYSISYESYFHVIY